MTETQPPAAPPAETSADPSAPVITDAAPARAWGGTALDVAAVISALLLIAIVADILADGKLSAPLRRLRDRGGPPEGPASDD